MHVVDDVPLLSASTSLFDALGAMRTHQRSAVCRESRLGLGLIHLPILFDALVQQLSELSNISASIPVYRISPADVSVWSLDLHDPYRTETSYEALLDAMGYLYALIKPSAGTASIVTRHEPLGDSIQAVPKQCRCRGPRRHGFPDPHVSHGQLCPDCQFQVDCF
jgi:hypothetical protein